MKKMTSMILTLLLCVFLSSGAYAVDTWHPVDSVIIVWDTIVEPAGGGSFDPDETVKYYVYKKNPDGSEISVIGSTMQPVPVVPEIQHTAVIDSYGKLILGVSAVVVWIPDSTEYNETTVSWSDNPIVCKDGNTFGIIRIHILSPVGGLRKP